MEPINLPLTLSIGRAADLLNESVNNIRSSFGLTRLGWYIFKELHDMYEEEKSTLVKRIKPFAREESIEDTLATFINNGLINEDKKKLSLTMKGLQLYNSCNKKYELFRCTLMKNISVEENQTLSAALDRMVDNICHFKEGAV